MQNRYIPNKLFRGRMRDASAVAIGIAFCVIVAILIMVYPTCPECDERLEVFTDEYCANCGANVRELTCNACGKEVDRNYASCVYCGAYLISNQETEVEQ